VNMQINAASLIRPAIRRQVGAQGVVRLPRNKISRLAGDLVPGRRSGRRATAVPLKQATYVYCITRPAGDLLSNKHSGRRATAAPP